MVAIGDMTTMPRDGVRERSCAAQNLWNLVVIENSERIETHKFCAPSPTTIYQHLPTNKHIPPNLHWNAVRMAEVWAPNVPRRRNSFLDFLGLK